MVNDYAAAAVVFEIARCNHHAEAAAPKSNNPARTKTVPVDTPAFRRKIHRRSTVERAVEHFRFDGLWDGGVPRRARLST